MVFMVHRMKKVVVSRGNAPRSVGYRPTALLLSYETEGWRGAPNNLGTPLRWLVQERHIGHRAALGFRVHHNTMPERQ